MVLDIGGCHLYLKPEQFRMLGISEVVGHALARDMHVAVMFSADFDKHIAVDAVLVTEQPINEICYHNTNASPFLCPVLNGVTDFFEPSPLIDRPGSRSIFDCDRTICLNNLVFYQECYPTRCPVVSKAEFACVLKLLHGLGDVA